MKYWLVYAAITIQIKTLCPLKESFINKGKPNVVSLHIKYRNISDEMYLSSNTRSRTRVVLFLRSAFNLKARFVKGRTVYNVCLLTLMTCVT
jgi:hypothetical protein